MNTIQEMAVGLDKEIVRLLRSIIDQHALKCEALTQEQFTHALVQALPDFERLVEPDGGQQVVYMPGREAAYWKRLYDELLSAVRLTAAGESRHDAALRYIREAQGNPDRWRPNPDWVNLTEQNAEVY